MAILWRLALAAMTGVLTFLSYPTFDVYALTWFAFVPLLWAIRDLPAKQAFYYGWVAGFVTHIGGFYWITGLLVTFGRLPSWLAFPITCLLCAYQGLRVAVFAWLTRGIEARTELPLLGIAPVVFCVAEYLIWHLFPSYLANSQYKFYAIIQICEVTGVQGLSFLIMLVNVALFSGLDAVARSRPLPWRGIAIAAAAFALTLGFGYWRISYWDQQMAEAKKLRILMVEANIGIFEKEAKNYPPHLRARLLRHNLIRHQKLAALGVKKYKPDLVVMSESAYQTLFAPVYVGEGANKKYRLSEFVIPRTATYLYQSKAPLPKSDAFPDDVEEDRRHQVRIRDYWSIQRGFHTPVLFGGITGEWNMKRNDFDSWNTALLIDEKGKILGRYDKTYLLMFGEYLPFGERFPVLYKWVPAASRFLPGRSVESIPFKGHNLAVMICYEAVIPEFTRKLAGKKPEVLINITNDAWFGKTTEPYLHLALTVFRAVENRLWLVRNTNTGISAFVDAVGRIRQQTSVEGEEILFDSVPLLTYETIYRR
ncbi:MAG: apolipoprotein N-acyltransferase, partial [Myxococcales bacterium]|nr:apolipoprotein N-acyltransferase [Myxococcales bacterium]